MLGLFRPINSRLQVKLATATNNADARLLVLSCSHALQRSGSGNVVFKAHGPLPTATAPISNAGSREAKRGERRAPPPPPPMSLVLDGSTDWQERL
jgi:hypothetical protein